MIMSNFDEIGGLANQPGVIHKAWCTMCSSKEAEGTLEVFMDDDKTEIMNVPICEECFARLLDRKNTSMLD